MAESGPALLDFLAAAVRAEDFPFFVVDEQQDLGEGLDTAPATGITRENPGRNNRGLCEAETTTGIQPR